MLDLLDGGAQNPSQVEGPRHTFIFETQNPFMDPLESQPEQALEPYQQAGTKQATGLRAL